jgi:dTDP-4-dehydrorhamnose 3,5-epimerase-like enzyme
MSKLGDIHWIDLPSHRDARGVLTSIESETDIPFTIRRIFYLHHVVADRGGHAHRDTDQVIIAMSGSLKVDLSDGTTIRTYELCDPTRGLYMPRMLFVKLYAFSPDAVCLVLANTQYDMSKSIRNWQEYLTAIGERLAAE